MKRQDRKTFVYKADCRCCRYREKSPSSYPNWIEIPVNPPDARFSQIFNLQPNTVYEFQVIGTNEYGDGMFSEIIQASTKGKILLPTTFCHTVFINV